MTGKNRENQLFSVVVVGLEFNAPLDTIYVISVKSTVAPFLIQNALVSFVLTYRFMNSRSQ